MTNLQTLVLAVTVILGLGMIGEYGPAWVRAFADLQLARRRPDLYPATVVRVAVRGALIAHADLEDEAADRTACLVVDELETNAAVFDGHEWRALDVLSLEELEERDR